MCFVTGVVDRVDDGDDPERQTVDQHRRRHQVLELKTGEGVTGKAVQGRVVRHADTDGARRVRRPPSRAEDDLPVR